MIGGNKTGPLTGPATALNQPGCETTERERRRKEREKVEKRERERGLKHLKWPRQRLI